MRDGGVQIALGFVVVSALLLRVVAIAEPLGIDQSLWASAVRGMARGQRLYRDVWEQRPPGIYLTYLTGFRLLGWRPSTVAWLDIVAAMWTTGLLWSIARPLVHRTTAMLAAALYAALTMPAWLFGNGGFLERSICETFIVVCMGIMAWCAVRLRERPTTGLAALLGLAAGGAVAFKPNAGLYFPAVLMWLAAYGPVAGSRERTSVWRMAAVATAAAALVPLLSLLWLWQLGVLHDARVAVIDFNRFYVADGFTVRGSAQKFSHDVWLRMKTDPLWLAGSVGAVVAMTEIVRRRRLDPLAGLAVLWGGAAAGVIIVNGIRPFNSYFLQAGAPLALLAAWFLMPSAEGRTLGGRALRWGTIGLMVLLLVSRGYLPRVFAWAQADFDSLRGATPRAAYLDRFGGYANDRGYSARANEELADYIRLHTTPDERVYLFGINGAGVYFAADRLTAHRFLRVNFFVPSTFPDPDFTLASVTRGLRAARPRYLIFERLHSSSEMGQAVDGLAEQPEVRALLSGYSRETVIEDFTLFRAP